MFDQAVAHLRALKGVPGPPQTFPPGPFATAAVPSQPYDPYAMGAQAYPSAPLAAQPQPFFYQPPAAAVGRGAPVASAPQGHSSPRPFFFPQGGLPPAYGGFHPPAPIIHPSPVPLGVSAPLAGVGVPMGGAGIAPGGAATSAYGEPPPINTLHVSSISPRVKKLDIVRLFIMCTGYVATKFMQRSGRAPIAWIQFESADHAAAARAATDRATIGGRPIRVGFAKNEMKSVSRSIPTAHRTSVRAGGDVKLAPRAANPPVNTLYITGLSHSTTEIQLRTLVSSRVGCKNVRYTHKQGRAPHAFALFEDVAAATAALNGLQGHSLNGKPMRVQFAKAEMHGATPRPTEVVQ